MTSISEFGGSASLTLLDHILRVSMQLPEPIIQNGAVQLKNVEPSSLIVLGLAGVS